LQTPRKSDLIKKKMVFLKRIKVDILYDEELLKITGKASEPAIISDNLQFVQFLNFIFTSYPEIQVKFPPGSIGFLVDGKAPQALDTFKDGDKLEIMTFKQI